MTNFRKSLNGEVIPALRLIQSETQKLDGSSAAVAGDVISATEESVILLSSESSIHYLVGDDPTATEDDMLLPGGMIWLLLNPGEKISILGGVGYICPAG